MAISKRLRHEVMRRDGYTCQYCFATGVPLTIDHVTPRALGGTDAPTNLVVACIPCNAGKTSTLPNADTVDGPDPASLQKARDELAAAGFHEKCFSGVYTEIHEAAERLVAKNVAYWCEPDEGFGARFHRRDTPCFDVWQLVYLLFEDLITGHDLESSLKEAANPLNPVRFCAQCCPAEAAGYNVEQQSICDDVPGPF